MSRFLLRSAGFPFAVADLRSPAVVTSLHELDVVRARVLTLSAEFSETVFASAIQEQQRRAPDRATFKALYRARRQVLRGRAVGDVPGLGKWAQSWGAAVAAVAAAERDVEDEANRAHAAARARLRALADEPDFRDAVALSSPGALERVVTRSGAPTTGSRARQDDRLLYAYAQRLGTKNETVSRFGPIDYGRVAGHTRSLRLESSVALQAQWARLTHWAVESLASAACREPEVRDRLPAALRPGWWVRERSLVAAPTGRCVHVDNAELAVLRACLQATPWGELCASSSRDALERLVERGAVGPQLVVPAALDDPAAWLGGELARLARTGSRVAERWRRELDSLRALASRIEGARGDERAANLKELEAEFERLTGTPARRGAGAHYADRLVVTEDCRGDLVRCDLGEPGASTLADRLSLFLALSASFSLLVQGVVARHARDVYARLAGADGVPFLRLTAALETEIELGRLIDEDPEVSSWLYELDAAVGKAVGGDASARLRPRDVRHLLRPLPPALLASPDIFLDDQSAPGADLATMPLVVGELHHGAQVWTHLSALDPEPDTVGAEIAGVLAAERPDLATLLCRRTEGKAFEREVGGTVVELRTRAAHPRAHPIRAEALTVRLDAGELQLMPPCGPALRLRPRHPRAATSWLFGLVPLVAPPVLRNAPTAPRVTVGDVIAWRRRWTLGGAALNTLRAAASAGGLVRAADDAIRRDGLPDRAFARADGARKPVYADLRCPMSLAHLAHHARRADRVMLTEVLPEPERWWLRRAGGRTGCELRFTLVSATTVADG